MKNVKEVKIEIKGKEWESALDKAFEKKKKDIKVPGFRKGAVPKDIYIKKVGIEALFMDAADIAINDAYKKALEKETMELVCEPTVAIDSIDSKSVKFTFTLIGRPEIKLGKYKKLGIKKEEVKVSKEDIEHEIEHLKGHLAEVVVKEDGEIVEGNTAVIDFDGVVDGKPLEGGSGKDYPLEIGSNTFIPGFESELVGMKVGETKVLNLHFPEDYTKGLKGKAVEFTVTIKEIKERILPEMNKDFFEDLGIEGVDSKEKLEAHLKEEIKHQREHQAEDKYIDELLRTATDNMEVEINPEIIDSEVERMIKEYSQQLAMQGLSFDQYIKMTGGNIEDVKSMMKPQAIARIKTRYLLEEVIKAEKIEATEEEVKAEIAKLVEAYQIEETELLGHIGGKDMIEYQVKMDKALEVIKEG